MFDSLTEKLNAAFKRFTDKGRLTEQDVDLGLREVRLALLEADVNYKVARQFVDRVRERAVGSDVLQSLSPGQQVIKLVFEELVDLLGGEDQKLRYQPEPPTTVMLMGLQGSGKTTTAIKLALLTRREGHRPLVVAADLQRAAAVEQLQALGRDQQVDVLVARSGRGRLARGVAEAVSEARRRGADVVLVDTAGRQHLDQPLMEELAQLRQATRFHLGLLVVDAMTGQEAVRVAQAFQDGVGVDGVVLTKLDGDARGGAALSMRAAVGLQVFYCGVGERPADLEAFHPERMARRILGMGDVLTLVERARQELTEEETERAEERLRQGRLTLDDFMVQMRQLRRLGPLESILGMLPGGGQLLRQQGGVPDESQMRRIEAIMLSMTPQERRRPSLIDSSRRRRIARGSGTSTVEVSRLIKGFEQMQEVLRGYGGAGGRHRLAADLLQGGAPMVGKVPPGRRGRS